MFSKHKLTDELVKDNISGQLIERVGTIKQIKHLYEIRWKLVTVITKYDDGPFW